MPLHFVAWKDNCDAFGIHLTPEILVELAGKSVDELFDILCDRSGRTGQVDRNQVRCP
jgi:beta-phosphoglucomutase-like phosphatase (HAD superfamily)